MTPAPATGVIVNPLNQRVATSFNVEAKYAISAIVLSASAGTAPATGV